MADVELSPAERYAASRRRAAAARTELATFRGLLGFQLDDFQVAGCEALESGRGVLVGTLLGALIVGVFRSGLSLAGVDDQYRVLAIGVLVIVAVSVDQWIRRARA